MDGGDELAFAGAAAELELLFGQTLYRCGASDAALMVIVRVSL